MNPEIDFYFVDVFAQRPLTGNPLALVPNADDLDADQMRAIAREFNQSETTFLLRPTSERALVRLRSFTPAGAEVGGAGHNALGAWLWLAQTGYVGSGTFTQEIGADLLEVAVTHVGGERIDVAMTQSAPVFGATLTDHDDLAAALGLRVADLDRSHDAQVVATGVGHLLVPLLDRTTVDRVDPDRRALRDLLATVAAEGCYVYTTDAANGAHAYARFFNPTVGITEDPATGTAAGPLAAALIRDSTLVDNSDVVIDQGHALGRPSRLVVHVDGDHVRLTGSGLVVGTGRLAV